VHGTLNHLLYGDRAWMSRFLGRDLGWKGPADELYADFDMLREARATLDGSIEDWAGRLEGRWLTADFAYTSRIDDPGETDLPWLPQITSGKGST
jgi:uncharacterized damage-inducible protein DinB